MDDKPCPQRIPYDSGVSFSLGITLGTIWNTFTGYRSSPTARWEGMKRAVRANAPKLGGKFSSSALSRKKLIIFSRQLCSMGNPVFPL